MPPSPLHLFSSPSLLSSLGTQILGDLRVSLLSIAFTHTPCRGSPAVSWSLQIRVLLSLFPPLAASLQFTYSLTAKPQVTQWSRTAASGVGDSPGSQRKHAFSYYISLLLLFSPCLLPSLVLLVILNMMLFYKLWMLEYTTQTLTAWQGLRLQER